MQGVVERPAAHLALTFLGAQYLLLLGGQALWQHRRAASTAPEETGQVVGNPWRTGLVGDVLNPKSAVFFYTGLLPTLAPPNCPPPGP